MGVMLTIVTKCYYVFIILLYCAYWSREHLDNFQNISVNQYEFLDIFSTLPNGRGNNDLFGKVEARGPHREIIPKSTWLS